MFKKVIFAAAFVLVSSPAFVSAQDFFWSFEENSRVATQIPFLGQGSETAYIFADENLDFNQLDLNFDTDNGGVVAFTGGRVYNPGAAGSGTQPSTFGGAFTSFDLDQLTATGGRIFGTSFLSPGQVPGSGASNFRAGANGFLLAAVDFNILGSGPANLDFVLGPLGVVNDGVGQVPVTFGAAALELCPLTPDPLLDPGCVPEPSSATLLILGAAGMFARRRRS